MEMRHPEIVSAHLRDQMRRVLEVYAVAEHLPVRAHNVGYCKVQDGAGMIDLRLLRTAEHQANAPAVEESQGAGGEQQRQSKNVPVKCGGPVDIIDVDCDLAQARNSDG